MGDGLEQTIAVLNGLVGDYLVRQGNGLATEMGCYLDGRRVRLTAGGLRGAYPEAGPRLAVFVHGVMCTETIWRFPDGSDCGQKLRDDLGITPVYLRYNSGQAIADNGAELDRLLETLVSAWPTPVQELIPVGYSMGGLLVRSACHHASQRGADWVKRVRRAIYVGTPHLGTPAERFGRLAAKLLRAVPDPYTRLVAEVGDLRSAGVKDLGDADLRHEDRASLRGRLSLSDPRHPVPLLPGIEHALVAGSLSVDPRIAALFGDAIVPVRSATARGMIEPAPELPPDRLRVVRGVSHVDLPRHPEVWEFIRRCCEEASR
ncbi:MAG: alpha/beta hydrolase [Myxococcales bacterium]|jgi:hypothetical protein